MNPVPIAGLRIGKGQDLVLIAGPCVIEDEAMTIELATAIAAVARASGVPFIFKASYDKANRTSIKSFRGPGLRHGLEILAAVRANVGVPILTDVHSVEEAHEAGEVVDILQIPAFLCRQTDLVVAAAETGRAVNIKKGPFLAPDDIRFVVEKAASVGNGCILVTERGTSFGYHDLVFDPRSLLFLQETGCPVVFDATHSVQKPGGGMGCSTGERRFVPALTRAAVAIGIDALYLEVHPNPDNSPSDASTILPLAWLPGLLRDAVAIHSMRTGFLNTESRVQGGEP